jgi:hypothetical protein
MLLTVNWTWAIPLMLGTVDSSGAKVRSCRAIVAVQRSSRPPARSTDAPCIARVSPG